jgi:hypothetical protein
MQNACVDIEFVGVSADTLKERYGNRMPPKATVVAAPSSTMLRTLVPKVDPTGDFAKQQSSVREGQQVALRLLRWFSDGGG